MKEKLEKLLEHASSLYFHYPVAAILECQDGSLFEGVNVETSSPMAGICAERNALFSAIAKGYQKQDFKCIHLMAATKEALYPCFICRQALYDYCPLEMPIHVYTTEKEIELPLKDLCPHAFGNEDLK